MALLEIIHYPSKILRTISKEVVFLIQNSTNS